MSKKNEYQIFYQFHAIGKITIQTSNVDEARHSIECDEIVQPDEIIKLVEPCKVLEIKTLKGDESKIEESSDVDYKSWGSE